MTVSQLHDAAAYEHFWKFLQNYIAISFLVHKTVFITCILYLW